MASGGAAAGAAAAAAALAAAQGYQMLVGGLLLQLPPDDFEAVYRQVGGLVLTGCTKTFWLKRPRARYYFLPCHGVTLYCRLLPDGTLDIPDAVEVHHVQLGPLAEYLGR
jgi:hypothetical protein